MKDGETEKTPTPTLYVRPKHYYSFRSLKALPTVAEWAEKGLDGSDWDPESGGNPGADAKRSADKLGAAFGRLLQLFTDEGVLNKTELSYVVTGSQDLIEDLTPEMKS